MVETAAKAPRGELHRYAMGHFDAFRGDTFDTVAADQLDFLHRHLNTYHAQAEPLSAHPTR